MFIFERLANRLLGSSRSKTGPQLIPEHFKAVYLNLGAMDAAGSDTGSYRCCGAGAFYLQ